MIVPESTADSPPLTDLERMLQTGVVDPLVFTKHLRGVSIFGPSGEDVQEVQLRGVLKIHAGKRCALEIALRTGDRWRSVIAKMYRKDRSDLFRAMKGIEQSGFGPQDEFSIPQPLAYVPSLHCLLQEKVEGTLADEVFETGDDRTRAAAAERCALWLARFQACTPQAGESLDANDFLNSKSMQKYAREIARRGGPCADKAAALLQRLEEALASLSPVPMCAGHGSYAAGHILLAGGRTVVLDWDGYDVADAARDATRFLAALRRLAFSRFGFIKALDGTAEVFLKTYQAAGQPELQRNLRFFDAAACLNMAKHSLCRPFPLWQEKQRQAEAMLDEGFAVLDGARNRGAVER